MRTTMDGHTWVLRPPSPRATAAAAAVGRTEGATPARSTAAAAATVGETAEWTGRAPPVCAGAAEAAATAGSSTRSVSLGSARVRGIDAPEGGGGAAAPSTPLVRGISPASMASARARADSPYAPGGSRADKVSGTGGMSGCVSAHAATGVDCTAADALHRDPLRALAAPEPAAGASEAATAPAVEARWALPIVAAGRANRPRPRPAGNDAGDRVDNSSCDAGYPRGWGIGACDDGVGRGADAGGAAALSAGGAGSGARRAEEGDAPCADDGAAEAAPSAGEYTRLRAVGIAANCRAGGAAPAFPSAAAGAGARAAAAAVAGSGRSLLPLRSAAPSIGTTALSVTEGLTRAPASFRHGGKAGAAKGGNDAVSSLRYSADTADDGTDSEKQAAEADEEGG